MDRQTVYQVLALPIEEPPRTTLDNLKMVYNLQFFDK
jgi:hypothetical protein